MQDATTSVVLAIFFLCVAAPSASYSAQWSEPPQLCEDSFITIIVDITDSSFSCDEEKLTGLLAGLAVSTKCYCTGYGMWLKLLCAGSMQRWCYIKGRRECLAQINYITKGG